MNTIRQDIRKYLELRRALGYRLKNYDRQLEQFVDFLEQHGSSHITRDLAIAWAGQPSDKKSRDSRKRVSLVRGFARYRKANDPRTEIPEPGIFAARRETVKPYLYSAEEIDSLLQAARQMPCRYRKSALQPCTYYCLIGLLSVTGLRLAEACNLKLEHVDLENALLTIHAEKHGRTRLVPLHETSCQVLADYVERRRRHWHNQRVSDYLFVSSAGTRLSKSVVQQTFVRLCRQVGLRGPHDRTGPRLHDLRHRFATQVLECWYRNNQDPRRLLPVLSTFLGHVCISDTYWYLQFNPGLMTQAIERLESCWEKFA